MMESGSSHRLIGLEHDNPLAFLALLGLLRSLEAFDSTQTENDKVRPRVYWDLEHPPLRPIVQVRHAVTPEAIAEMAAFGLAASAKSHSFQNRKDLNFTREEARGLLEESVLMASLSSRERVDLMAALMTDGAVRGGIKKEVLVEPTPLCLLFGQGHQHFLERLDSVPHLEAPEPRSRDKKRKAMSAAECLFEALFQTWRREDPTPSMRWDPEEDVRYAHMAGNPIDPAYKTRTQHGANRLACVGLASLPVVPKARGKRVRAQIPGGDNGKQGEFLFAWPIWAHPARLDSIVALLSHPGLLAPESIRHLGVDQVMVSRRISVGKFMNLTRGRVSGS